jgi:hypothetical protein
MNTNYFENSEEYESTQSSSDLINIQLRMTISPYTLILINVQVNRPPSQQFPSADESGQRQVGQMQSRNQLTQNETGSGER